MGVDNVPIIELVTLGYVDIGKKLSANLSIKSDELFTRFAMATKFLTNESKELIRLAIDEEKEPKVQKNAENITKFFEMVRNQLSSLGFGTEETLESMIAESVKGEQKDEGEVSYESGQETYDTKTGEKEGTITYGENDMDSLLVPIKIKEKIELNLNSDGTPKDEDLQNTGIIELYNKSDKDRLWDIDVKFDNLSQTDIKKDSIKVKELNPLASKEIEYTFQSEAKPELEVKEFISTANDPEVASHSLALNAENEIYMKITLNNNSDDKLAKIEVRKMLPEYFSNVQIVSESTGKSDVRVEHDNRIAFWEIEELDANSEAIIEFRVFVFIDNKDMKIRSGELSVNYQAPLHTSGIEVSKFDAYTNNSFNIITSELDEEPNSYECKFIFENKSEYLVRLVNADVYDPDNKSNKFVDIDPNEIPEIPGGGQWESESWVYNGKEGIYPSFKTKVEFFAIADHQFTTEFKINQDDVALAVASIDGSIQYSLDKLQSFKITPFNLMAKISNTGGALLDEVTLVEKIQSEFLPPKPEEVEVLVNGATFDVSSDAITIEPEDQDPATEHTVTIKLMNLKDSSYGGIKPGDEVEFKYPITAFKPTRETLYHADTLLTANTYPPGKPLEIKAEPIDINVVHVRSNIARGKDIRALDEEGEYEITLSVKNMGEGELVDYALTEKIPEALVLLDVSEGANIGDEGESKVLTWNFESIPANEIVEVKYKIKSSGDVKVSETQKGE